MSRAKEQRLALDGLIDEASDLLEEIKEVRISVANEASKLKQDTENQHKKIREAGDKVGQMASDLRKLLGESRRTAEHLNAHDVWKKTVLAEFGEEGLQRCFNRMEGFST